MEKYQAALTEVSRELSNLGGSKSLVYSTILFGSLARGDFLNGVSDVDIFLVIDWPQNKTADDWRKMNERCKPIQNLILDYFNPFPVPESKGYLLELVTLPKGNLPMEGRPLSMDFVNDYLIFKYFGVYRFDNPNWKILYGEDFREKLTPVDYQKLIPLMASNMLERIELASTSKGAVRLGVDIIRLAQIHFAEPTLDNRVVLANFEAKVPDFPAKYLAPRIWELSKKANQVTEKDIAPESIRSFVEQLATMLTLF
jgi:predicted nucleotidyltransferase